MRLRDKSVSIVDRDTIYTKRQSQFLENAVKELSEIMENKKTPMEIEIIFESQKKSFQLKICERRNTINTFKFRRYKDLKAKLRELN